jgi:peptidoglycan/LPS O-acetylase OafA/YrhL
VLVLGSVVSFVCAALSYYFLEKPCLKLKERFTNPATPTEPSDNVVFDSPVPQSLNT